MVSEALTSVETVGAITLCSSTLTAGYFAIHGITTVFPLSLGYMLESLTGSNSCSSSKEKQRNYILVTCFENLF